MHDHVDVVEVNDIRSDGTARLIKELLKILRPFHGPPRRFGGDIDTVTPSSRECLSDSLFTLSVQVDTPSINIVYTTFNCPTYHGHTLVKIHTSVCLHRQSEHTKPQCGNINSGTSHWTILHPWIIIQNFA